MIVSGGQALDFAPQALGEITPNVANGYFYAKDGLPLLGLYATYAQLYRAQPSIATVIDKVSNSAARLKPKVWDNSSQKTGKILDTSSPLAKLIAAPCSFLSPYAFYRWTFATYEVYGEAYWFKQRNSAGKVVNLLPMHPSRTAIHRLEDGSVEYIFALGGVASTGLIRAPSEDVVVFQRYNPETLMRGMSRLEPLRTTLLNEDAARRANESWWKRGARPSVVLEHPDSLSQPAQDRLKASFDARMAGADNMGGTAVLEEGMKANIIQLNAEEMQYIETRKLNLQEVCMVFDVPPPVIHILDHATFSNITEQMRSMYRDTMAPRLEDVESVIMYSLVSEFGLNGREFQFDMADVVRGAFETRVTSAVSMRQAGISTGNEGRELVGLERIDDPQMDKLYANAAMAELGTPAQRISITEAVTPSPQQALEATATGQGAQQASRLAIESGSKTVREISRSVMGKAGRAGRTKPALRAAAVDEHAKRLGKFFATQQAAVKKAISQKSPTDLSSWDGDLADLLHSLSAATAQAIGAKVAADLGGSYDGKDIAAYLESNSTATAKKINATTQAQIIAALERAHQDDPDVSDDDTIDNVYASPVAARTQQISSSRVALIAGLASLVAARQSGAKTKTWITGGNPRTLHSEMDGETVPLGELFSNGMDGPGDYSGGADEVANCNCDLDFSMEGSA